MTPVTFAGCFGWLHEAPGDVGVLLCTGLGGEAFGAHFPLRVLADRLARAGYPTLRFDYANTGDSSDLPGEDPLAAWRASVGLAADHLRRSVGVKRMVLCGLRFGATLAALEAATRDDVAGLILLAPVVSGISYSRVLQARAQFARWTPPQEPGWLESDGVRLPAATLDALADINLGRADRPAAPRVLLMDPVGGNAVNGYAAGLRKAGAEVTMVGFEADKLLCHSFRSAVPEADYATLLAWLHAQVPSGGSDRAAGAPAAEVLRGPGWVEEPVRMGPAGHLFGVLCRPAGSACNAAMVIGNASTDPHYGSCRFHVELARHLAGTGFASLRMDFAGLGDSHTGVAGQEETQSDGYDVDRSGDFTTALDWLERRGYRRLALAGLSSGAYHALRGALADRRVAGLVLLNLTAFTWQPGQSVADAMVASRPPTRFYLETLRTGVAWRRLLEGKVNVPGVARTLARRALHRVALRGARLAELGGVRTASGLPRRIMRGLSQRGVRVLVASGLQGAGLELLEENFGARAARLAALPGCTVQIVPAIDHGLTRSQMRATVATRVADFLLAAFPEPPGASVPSAEPERVSRPIPAQ